MRQFFSFLLILLKHYNLTNITISDPRRCRGPRRIGNGEEHQSTVLQEGAAARGVVQEHQQTPDWVLHQIHSRDPIWIGWLYRVLVFYCSLFCQIKTNNFLNIFIFTLKKSLIYFKTLFYTNFPDPNFQTAIKTKPIIILLNPMSSDR